MNAPNRSAEVAAWVAAHPEHFIRPRPEVGADEVRRVALIPLCQALNRIDDGKWGRLLKTTRGNTIPHDIICWKDTDEHFDVFTGTSDPADTKARWGPNAPREGWTWISVEDANVPTPTDPPPVPPVDDTVARRLALLETTLLAQEGSITALRKNLVDVLETLLAVSRRLEQLDTMPAPPPFELPPLVAEGTTGRVFGHGHPVRLTVRRA